MSTLRPMLRTRPWMALLIIVVLTAGVLVAAAQTSPAHAASSTRYGVGSPELTAPAAGRRTIYVSTTGSDYARTTDGRSTDVNRRTCLPDSALGSPGCPEATADLPMRTIEAAIRAARPGDVIVVRGGAYAEAAGWGAVRGTANARITLQAHPGERVELRGTLKLRSADYWTVQGIRFIHNAAIQGSGQSIVAFQGGKGWRFLNNEVTGSTGVANLYVMTDTSLSDRVAAAPHDYVIAGNCIRENKGRNAHGMDHNIYLMSSIYSTGGLIERNLLAGAPNGSNIKAAGAGTSSADGSPRNVTIRYNTMLFAATGMVIGLKAEKIETQRNIIAKPKGVQQWDAGVKAWGLAKPGRNSVKDTVISGYPQPLRDTQGMYLVRNDLKTAVTYTGSVANCSVVPSPAAYGHLAP